jgi:hypothetical protein
VIFIAFQTLMMIKSNEEELASLLFSQLYTSLKTFTYGRVKTFLSRMQTIQISERLSFLLISKTNRNPMLSSKFSHNHW